MHSRFPCLLPMRGVLGAHAQLQLTRNQLNCSTDLRTCEERVYVCVKSLPSIGSCLGIPWTWVVGSLMETIHPLAHKVALVYRDRGWAEARLIRPPMCGAEIQVTYLHAVPRGNRFG